jgi:hypothetical protein
MNVNSKPLGQQLPAGLKTCGLATKSMRQECPDCQRLWREYAAATTEHVVLEKKLRSLEQGSGVSGGLKRDVAAAATVREMARQAIHQHEADIHGDAAEAAKNGG